MTRVQTRTPVQSTAGILEEVQLIGCLDPLGDDVEAKRLGHLDHGSHQRGALMGRGHRGYE